VTAPLSVVSHWWERYRLEAELRKRNHFAVYCRLGEGWLCTLYHRIDGDEEAYAVRHTKLEALKDASRFL
jgi:hypothetical protein